MTGFSQDAVKTTPLDTPKIRFYLVNQSLIQQWAAIGTEVWQAVEATIRDLGVELDADPRLEARDGRVADQVSTETRVGPVLFRPAWDVTQLGTPDVGVAIGWDKAGAVDPAGVSRTTPPPFVGVLTAHDTLVGQRVKQLLAAEALPLTGPQARKYRAGSHWTIWRPLPTDPNWWQDVPKWSIYLVDELFATFDLYADAIERAVRAAGLDRLVSSGRS